MAQVTSQFQDPDAIFNQALTSLAFKYNPDPKVSGGGNLFASGGHVYGFRKDYWTYKFANGSTSVFQNVAATSLNFSQIRTGHDLFNAVDLPPTVSTSDTVAAVTSAPSNSKSSASAVASPTSSAMTSLRGYPSPVAIHPYGYTSGYFLANSTIAVLAMQAFIDPAKSKDGAVLQQATIKAFLRQARKAGMTKLIVDLQENGGGDVFAGFDAFKQLFPTLEPFGASRLRATPAVNYLGEVFSASGIYNTSSNTVYQFRSSLDVNNHAFSNWKAEDPPFTIYGDNFTQELRYNFSDIVTENNGGLNVTGYLNQSRVAPQLFRSEDIVILYDGSCGSTCAIFSELMKSQGGDRSIALGGRPQLGPMQGVAGSKGAQVYSYGFIAQLVSLVPQALMAGFQQGAIPPAFPPVEYIPNILTDPPLGNADTLAKYARFNLRNNMHAGDSSFTPLQFVYEAANCKLFYTFADQYKIQGLWERVAHVAWGKGKCVPSSSVNSDDSFPKKAYDTVPFGSGAYSSVVQDYRPGLMPQKKGV